MIFFLPDQNNYWSVQPPDKVTFDILYALDLSDPMIFPAAPPAGQTLRFYDKSLRRDELTGCCLFCPDFRLFQFLHAEVDASTRFDPDIRLCLWWTWWLFHVLCLLTYRLQTGSAGSRPVVRVSSPAVRRDYCCHICIFTAFTPQLLPWIENSSPSLPVLPKSSPRPILPPLPSVPDRVLPQ